MVAVVLAAAAAAHDLQAQQDWNSLRFSFVSAGGAHTCAITLDGTTLCWGANHDGELGAPSDDMHSEPVRVALPPLLAIAAGAHHTCGLDREGVVWCWGSNRFGQLGNRRSKSSHVPIAVASSVRFTALTVGDDHTCAVGTDKLAYCWGDQWDRAVGSFDAGDNVREAMLVQGSHHFLSLSAGARHTCGVTEDHRVFCWGDNSKGQVGTSSRSRATIPSSVDGVVGADTVTAAAHFTCALISGGELACWGAAPPEVSQKSATRFRMLAAGTDHLCGLSTAFALTCWGSDAAGQLSARSSNGSTAASSIRYTQISAGSRHTCAIDDGRKLSCWGDNTTGQLGPAVSAQRPGEKR